MNNIIAHHECFSNINSIGSSFLLFSTQVGPNPITATIVGLFDFSKTAENAKELLSENNCSCAKSFRMFTLCTKSCVFSIRIGTGLTPWREGLTCFPISTNPSEIETGRFCDEMFALTPKQPGSSSVTW